MSVGMKAVHRFDTACDFSEPMLLDAAAYLGAVLPDGRMAAGVMVFVSTFNTEKAVPLKHKWGFELVALPAELLKTDFTWGVVYAGALMWSPGC